MKKLNIEQRGALLVLFPLVCQIVFVVVLTGQLWSLHSNISQQSQSCELIAKTISLIAYSINLGQINQMQVSSNLRQAEQDRLQMTGVTNDQRRFALLNNKLRQIGARFEPDELQRNRIAVLIQTGEEVLKCLKDVRDNQKKGWRYWKHVHWQYEIALINSCQKMLNCADNVVEYEEAKRQGTESATNSQFQALNTYLLGAIALTVVAAFVMAVFFIRDILIPLKHLSANCLRISKQEELLPVLSDGSEFSQLDEILHSITEATKEEQEREKSMVENTNDLICSLSVDGKFLRANKSAREFFGVDPEALVGESFFDFVADQDRTLAEKGFKDALAEGESRSLEFRVKQADGLVHTRWSWLYSSESKELFAVVHNIEQEKVVENLRQDFVDMVSHDLRSPLSSMHVALDLVGQKAYGEISKEAEQEVAGARKNLIRLLDFVNDLLDFQKLKHGTLQLECDNAHVDGLVQSAVDFVKPALQAKEIEIETEGEDILLFADPKKIVQLLTNLLANAIQYTPKNGNISIAWTRHSDFTEISVSDTGPGIAEKFRKRIFEAFEQTPESVSQGEGTGLGLAICKLICDAHNGSIFVDSELGKGSKFIVRIPSPKG
jgi:PAS domain S-box-containing protein